MLNTLTFSVSVALVTLTVLYLFVGIIACLMNGLYLRSMVATNPEKFERRLRERFSNEKDIVAAVRRSVLRLFLFWPLFVAGRKKEWFEFM